MSTTGDPGSRLLPLPVQALRPVSARRRRSPTRDERARCSQYDALEQALTLCLLSLADLASEADEVERLARLRAALSILGVDAHGSNPRPNALPGRHSSTPSSISPLSGREHQVAALIAQGLTNREIAGALVISERTADTHVQNILCKLGLVSRAQIAAWFVGQNSAAGDSRAG